MASSWWSRRKEAHVEIVRRGADVAGEALERLKQISESASSRPHLIWMDIRMPNPDGIETMGRMLAEDRRIPIILHSAYGCYRDNYLTWAADAYLTKSADLDNLKDTIKALGVAAEAVREGS